MDKDEKKIIAIEIENVKKSYGNHHVVKDLNLKVDQREIYALCGENGAGKTTLIKILVGLIKQDSGKINFISFYMQLKERKRENKLIA